MQGENNDTLFVASSGMYALVNGAGDCIDTSECVMVQLTGVSSGERDHGVRIYPNPVSSHLYIDAPEGLHFKEISLRNSVGKKVYARRDVDASARIDLSGCGSGLYLLDMRLEGGGHVGFLVVKM